MERKGRAAEDSIVTTRSTRLAPHAAEETRDYFRRTEDADDVNAAAVSGRSTDSGAADEERFKDRTD